MININYLIKQMTLQVVFNLDVEKNFNVFDYFFFISKINNLKLFYNLEYLYCFYLL